MEGAEQENLIFFFDFRSLMRLNPLLHACHYIIRMGKISILK